MAENIFDGLNPEQQRAVRAVRGPVCILAGAGSGKTTTITRRIANQVHSGTFRPHEILAVTFTTKAAQELKDRLALLGVSGAPASTFHAAALRQIRNLAGEKRDVLSSKVPLLVPIIRQLPAPFAQRAASDIAREIEWAKNRRLTPQTYAGAQQAGRDCPLPVELMVDVFRAYERAKEASKKIDFEDQLELAIRLFQDDRTKLEIFQERYRAFTVDEYQDVNLLQQTLLELWVGERDDLCVVGDDYQSIFTFTGATPGYLLGMPRRYPQAAVLRLEDNYRSTPEVLRLANLVAPELGGARKVLRATRPSGPEPRLEQVASSEQEAALIAGQVDDLRRAGVPLREIAILYRVNFRSPPFEQALLRAGIPFQVREGPFLERPAAKALLPQLDRTPDAVAILGVVTRETAALGWLEHGDRAGIGPAEEARQADMDLFRELASEFADGTRTVAAFLAWLHETFEPTSDREAVQLLTYHSAKGLEFEAVFLPRLEERELPYWRQVEAGDVDEERRLFYVGLTRAKRHLVVTWSRQRQRSSFLNRLVPPPEPRQEIRKPVPSSPPMRRSGRTRTVRPIQTDEPMKKGMTEKSWRPDWMRRRGE